jgi:hypothetical protein
MVSQQKLAEALGRLALMRRFPNNPYALAALAEILKDICKTDEELAALVRDTLRTHDEWCGPVSLRRVHDGQVNPDGPYVRV